MEADIEAVRLFRSLKWHRVRRRHHTDRVLSVLGAACVCHRSVFSTPPHVSPSSSALRIKVNTWNVELHSDGLMRNASPWRITGGSDTPRLRSLRYVGPLFAAGCLQRAADPPWTRIHREHAHRRRIGFWRTFFFKENTREPAIFLFHFLNSTWIRRQQRFYCLWHNVNR